MRPEAMCKRIYTKLINIIYFITYVIHVHGLLYIQAARPCVHGVMAFSATKSEGLAYCIKNRGDVTRLRRNSAWMASRSQPTVTVHHAEIRGVRTLGRQAWVDWCMRRHTDVCACIGMRHVHWGCLHWHMCATPTKPRCTRGVAHIQASVCLHL